MHKCIWVLSNTDNSIHFSIHQAYAWHQSWGWRCESVFSIVWPTSQVLSMCLSPAQNEARALWLIFDLQCGPYLKTSHSQSVVPGPGASAPPGPLLEMQVLRPHSRSTESETFITLLVILTHSKVWEPLPQSHFICAQWKKKRLRLVVIIEISSTTDFKT